MKIIAIT